MTTYNEKPVERVLTVTNYGEVKGKLTKTRVTIAPNNVAFVIAGDETEGVIDNVEIRKVNVIMLNEANIELYVSFLDLLTIERVVGTYLLP